MSEQNTSRRTLAEVIEKTRDGVYLDFPEQWLPDACGSELDPWHQKAIRMLFLGEKGKVSARCSHNAGKTWLSAHLTLQFLLTFVPSRVSATGMTGSQTRRQYWAYLNGAWQDCVFKNSIEWQKTKMFIKGERTEEKWFAEWVASKNHKTLEGRHGPVNGKNMLWIVEEAKGVQRQAFEAIMGAMSSDDNYIFISSTCGPARGYFYDSHTKLRNLWDTIRVPATDVPRISPKKLEEWKIAWGGEDSPIFRARAMAEFVEDDDNVICPLQWLEDAVEDEDDENWLEAA